MGNYTSTPSNNESAPAPETQKDLVFNFETLEELDSFCKSSQFTDTLTKKAEEAIECEEKRQEIIDNIKAWEAAQKQKFHPEAAHPELQQLKQQTSEALDSKQIDKEEYRILVIKLSQLREQLSSEFATYDKVMGNLQKKIAITVNSMSRSGGRSNRAKRAGLLSKHAGKAKIEGVQTDKHGNALGTEFDLGVDGAFRGMEIIVVQLYEFPKHHTTSAFEKKGFSFQWFTKFPPAAEFAKILDLPTVCQLWVIGSNGSPQRIPTEILEIIKTFHLSGKSLYIWGDNTPFIVDANDILTYVCNPELNMFGNEIGSQVVHLCDPEAKKSGLFKNTKNVGFVEHLITTGLVHLFEGITVASFSEEKIRSYNFLPLMWGSAGNLITIYREADKQGGAIMCDGGFTRLYCNVDDAGTIRFIINCACWLAVESFGATTGPIFDEEEEEEQETLGYDYENAFSGGVCSITWEPAPVVCLSVLELADPEKNTGDMVLNDPLGFGEDNYRILGRHLYGESTAHTVLDMGNDPYQRQPVVGLLPLISLENFQNRKLFTDELCRVFMGHKKLFSAAQLLFIGVVDSALHPDRIENYTPETTAALQYLQTQALQYFTSTEDFTDVGNKIPIIDAMKSYFTISPGLTQISRSFNTVCLIARTLHSQSLVPTEELVTIVRRSLLKLILSNAIKFVKEQETNGNTVLKILLENGMYQCWNDIPLSSTGRVISQLPQFIPNYFQQPLQRFCKQVNVSYDDVLHLPSCTLVFHILTQKDLRSVRVESLLEILLKIPSFVKLWDGELVNEESLVAVLNKKFEGFICHDSHPDVYVPFATTFGPSVFKCELCNVAFGDPTHEVTQEYATSVKQKRNEHFRNIFGADVNGYPTKQSHIFSLHRCVQKVISNQFTENLEYTNEMSVAVAKEIANKNGNIHVTELSSIVETAIKSYLDCRKLGQPHPPGYVEFLARYKMEVDRLNNIK